MPLFTRILLETGAAWGPDAQHFLRGAHEPGPLQMHRLHTLFGSCSAAAVGSAQILYAANEGRVDYSSLVISDPDSSTGWSPSDLPPAPPAYLSKHSVA